jgi:hypothetical protein
MRATQPKKEREKRPFRGSRARSVTVYLAALFVITVLLLLLAYFMQERAAQTMAAVTQCFT